MMMMMKKKRNKLLNKQKGANEVKYHENYFIQCFKEKELNLIVYADNNLSTVVASLLRGEPFGALTEIISTTDMT